MADMVKFLRGLQSALPTTGVPGSFYLTTDTHRLYTAQADGKIVPVNEGVVTVDNVAALDSIPANAGDFFYATEENILCVYNGQAFIQINKQATLAELGGVSAADFNEKVAELSAADTTTLNDAKAYTDGKIGELGKDVEGNDYANVKAYVDAKTAGIATDAALGELQDIVDDHTEAIETINGDEDTIGSMKAIAKAYADGKDEAIQAAKDAADAAQDAADAAQGEVDALEGVVAEYKQANDARVKALEDADNATQAELDAAVEAINGEIAKKADADKVYTKTEIDGFVDALEGADATLQQNIDKLGETVAANEQDIEKKVADLDTAYKAADDEIKGMITSAIAEAKKYADDNDADTTYGIVYDSENKKINLVAGGTDTEIDVSDFIKDGMLSSVTADEANNTLTFAWNTDSGIEETTVALTALADIYTGSTGEHVTVAVSNENVISATLSDAVKASLAKADSALQEHQSLAEYAKKTEVEAVAEDLEEYVNAHASDYTNAQIDAAIKVNADAIADIVDTYATDAELEAAIAAEVERANGAYATAGHNHDDKYDAKGAAEAAEAAAKGHADGLNTAMDNRVKALEAIDHDAYKAADAELSAAIEAAKTEASNKDAAVLAEAQSYADQAEADAIAAAEGKVNALAGNVYTKAETYTQAEVDALIAAAHTWGEF